ncbi:MAG: hypothetical protein P1P84_18915 [Deferrisomatales bacterium]|nr:hypothetical protein [Deferrisomatales bacterium]
MGQFCTPIHMQVPVEKGLVSQEDLLNAVAAARQEMVGKARAGNVEQ